MIAHRVIDNNNTLDNKLFSILLRMQMMDLCPAAEKSDIIGPEGIEKLCEDIGVEPENVCWHFCAFYRTKQLC